MKPITIFVEFDAEWPTTWKPGYHRGWTAKGYFRRVWWAWFAIAWVPCSLFEWNRHVESGNTQWVVPKPIDGPR